jgi:hypothetical protein
MLKLGLKWLGRGFVLLREKGGGYQEVGNLEPSFNDGSHMEYVCQGWFHLGCLGGNNVVEREKLLASPYTTNLLLELEEDLEA